MIKKNVSTENSLFLFEGDTDRQDEVIELKQVG